MGIQEVEFIYAEGLDNRPHGRDAGIASARAQIARARRSGLSREEIVLALASFYFRVI
ncbi:FMN-dependent NADH-azoreductase [Klebsiella pneumoniae]|nr:FMN-dependent NADH-azoreductase [Klebsiella pneumoniae]